MRTVVTGAAVALAMFAVSVGLDADAAIDTHPTSVVRLVNPLKPAIFDPAPVGFPSFSLFERYKDEFSDFAAFAPPPAAPSLSPLGSLPALKLLDLTSVDGAREKAAPEIAQPDKPDLKQEAALTPNEMGMVPFEEPPTPSEGYMRPEEPAATVDVPALPPRRPTEADRARIPSGLGTIAFATATLPPMAHTLFCMKYPSECQIQAVLPPAAPITLTDERRAELVRINAKVNSAIQWKRMYQTPATEKWLISPTFGDCNDYAVTKRHELLALGWPSRDLLLAEVVTTWGEHHLVLVVRTDKGDFVADSIEKKILNWAEAPYRWVRVQKPDNPRHWATIQTPQPNLFAMTGRDSRL